jgi:DNA (cytosine-5)-methyltransferase 1
MLRVLSLFAGIGGFDLGLERTGGFKTVAFCEIDKKAQAVLRKHWPEVPCFENVQTLTAGQLIAAGIFPDAIAAGFPCPDISTAGRGAGIHGERSGLFFEIIRLVREFAELGHQIKLLLLENVAALLSRGLGDVLGALAAIGFNAWWDCIPASALGARHRRDRIWIVAYPESELWHGRGRGAELAGRDEPANGGEALAYAFGERQPRQGTSGLAGDPEAHGEGQAADALDGRLGSIWAVEPPVGRVANGVPGRVDRLKQLGNAVVPQIPELIGRAILASIEAERIAA